MKKIIVLLLLVLAIGCSKDAPDIVGTWALKDFTAINARTGEKLNGATDVKTWTFNREGSAYVNGNIPMTYTMNGKYLSLVNVNTGNEMVYEVEELSLYTLKVYWYAMPGKYQDGTDCWYTFSKME